MRKAIRYIANDNTEFDVKKDCEIHDLLIVEISDLMKKLNPTPVDSELFDLGNQFVQQDKEVFLEVRRSVLNIFKKYCDHHWIDQTINNLDVDYSYVNRIMGEYQIKPLSSAWCRIACIDKEYREWVQVYYANLKNKTK